RPPRSTLFPYTTLFRSMIQPQRRLARNGRQPVTLEMRIGMREPGGVVPHFPGVGNAPAKLVGDMMMQLAVGIRVRAVEHGLRHRSEEHTSELQSRENLV